MTYRTAGLDPTPLVPSLGAKVELDLEQPLSEETRAELRSVFNRHHLLFIRAPNLSSERQRDLFATFGRVLPIPSGAMEILVSNTTEDGYLGATELEWHADGSYVVEPYLANCLYAVDVQERKSATRFTSAAAACDRLPPELMERIRYLQVINTHDVEVERGKRVATLGPDLAGAAHRFISRHPVTGIPYIAANFVQTDCVLGLDVAESKALLLEVYHYLYMPEYVYEHRWCNGDLVIWDNLLVQHQRGRMDASTVGNRTLRRLTLGTATTAEQVPERQHSESAKLFSARIGPQARDTAPQHREQR